MTKNRKLFEEIDQRSRNIQDSPTKTSSVGEEFWVCIWLWTLLVSLVSSYSRWRLDSFNRLWPIYSRVEAYHRHDPSS